MPVSDAQVLVAAICECDWDGRTFEVLGAADKKRYMDRSRAALEAALSLPQGAPDGWKLVPISALEWLNGSGPNAEGYWFGDFPGDALPKGKYWWRSHFMAMIPASPDPEGL